MRDIKDLVGEVWKTHPTLGIKVSNLGRVETRNLGKQFGSNDSYGYKQIGCKYKMYRVHILVYQTFIGEIPEGYQVNHIDEDKTNNRVGNLNLMTHKENINWGTRNERASKTLTNRKDLSKTVQQFTKSGELVNEWASTHEAERLGGFKHGDISKCCNGKLKTHGGYIWRYKEEV